jgi:hypothetical protein
MFRHGQWVLFDGADGLPAEALAGAHRAAGGAVVGVYQRGGRDAAGGAAADAVYPVGPDGHNLALPVGGEAVTLRLAPGACRNLRPCTAADDLPGPRRRHLPPGARLPA